MPGYNQVLRDTVKNLPLFDKYQCPNCHLLLKDAVQPLCGHWMCESCAVEVLITSSSIPKCLLQECQKDLSTGPGEEAKYFSDWAVRKEIHAMILSCPHQSKGCNWEDSLGKLEAHLKTCDFTSEECPQCGTVLTPEQVEPHKLTCPKAMVKCPLVGFGCLYAQAVTREELQEHLHVHAVEVLQATVKVLGTTEDKPSTHPRIQIPANHFSLSSHTTSVDSYPLQESTNTPPCGHVFYNCSASPYHPFSLNTVGAYVCTDYRSEENSHGDKLTPMGQFTTENEHPAAFESGICVMFLDDRGAPGTTVWRIPDFEHQLSDAQSGRNSAALCGMPFYTSPQGYKMCLRVYLNGDGIGKNSHMSLFFVVMKGEFDNILQWPFTHKVTFKLINQTGGRDIIDTFQPDPMSSSFRKPKSDMNIASGCPRFVSHTELKSGNFVKDDTIFIKCIIDSQV